MSFLSRAKKVESDTHPMGQTTRFKRVHVRNKPAAQPDTGIDLRDQLTRTSNTHVRKAPEPVLRTAPPVTKAAKRDEGSDLHATQEPISVNILRRALPMRYNGMLAQ